MIHPDTPESTSGGPSDELSPLAAFSKMLAWSQSRPIWQRDALRRLAAGSLSHDDLEELVDLCLAEAVGVEEPAGLELTADHLPAASTRPEDTVTLSVVSEVQGVNLLAPGQTLCFSKVGVTLIYGDNGTGKSGYSRILKQVCRVRGGAQRILADVYKAATAPNPSALLSYQQGPTELTYRWSALDAGPAELRNISVFDAHAADHLLTQEADDVFAPEALTILERLAEACKGVERILDERRNSLVGSSRALPAFSPTPQLVDSWLG